MKIVNFVEEVNKRCCGVDEEKESEDVNEESWSSGWMEAMRCTKFIRGDHYNVSISNDDSTNQEAEVINGIWGTYMKLFMHNRAVTNIPKTPQSTTQPCFKSLDSNSAILSSSSSSSCCRSSLSSNPSSTVESIYSSPRVEDIVGVWSWLAMMEWY